MKRNRHAEAADALHEALGASPPIELVDRLLYDLGKSLYRLKLFHSALEHFSKVLEAGPTSSYFNAALEWTLFIGRQMVDDRSVNEVLTRYGSTEQFPDQYRDEFFFRLARYHFSRSVEAERDATMPVQISRGREDDSVSFSGDLFGTASGQTKSEDTKSSKKGISVGEDLFSSGSKSAEQDDSISLSGDLFGTGERGPPVSEVGSLTADTHLTQAERFALRVNPDSTYGARAKFLEALVLFKRRKENEALGAFKEVVRLTREDDRRSSRRLREMAFFQLARTHFGAQQPTFSNFYYGKIDRDSVEWLDSLYEESWSQFRLGNYEKALGNLLTLHSPFFGSSYYPESRILEAVIYYENCRYKEAKDILTRFQARYEPVLVAIQQITEKYDSAAQFVAVLDGLENEDIAPSAEDAEKSILAQILQLALADPDLARVARSLEEVRREKAQAQVAGLRPSTASALDGILSNEMSDLEERAGRAVERRLREERENIKSLLQQAVRIDIETARSEQERIESRLREVQSRPKDSKQTFVEWTDDEKLVWPFEGEYWRDELGTYELTLARSCR
ncbi:MAG: hypothetical protein HC923_08740 [Myxococcales bacterium]|nr:hypothetical protein [Myxococcales bacterium]